MEIKKQLGETDSQYLPVPSDAPIEFPRLIINYPNLNIRFFKNRVDLFFQKNHEEEKLEKVMNVLSNTLGLPIARIGFVKTFFAQSNIEPIKQLLVEGKLAGLNVKEVNLRVNVSRNINGFDCNSIEKIDPGNVTSNNGVVRSGLIILKDCNTLQENNLPDSLNVSKLKELIASMSTETDNFVLV